MFRNLARFASESKALQFNSLYHFSSAQKVRVIKSHSNSIYWNLATEEYLFESSDLNSPTLFLYREDKTIIIGRHQNPWKECFLQEMKKDGVDLCRRKSGGGAVYQDLGNTCFSFLIPMHEELNPDRVKENDNRILISALKQFGVDVTASGRNDLVVGDKKISGSAFKLNLGKSDGSGRKYLHHGTMLINVDLDVLQRYLNPNKQKLLSKGITSIRARVENLSNMNSHINHDTFSTAVINEFLKTYGGYECILKEYTEDDMKSIPEVKKIYDEMTSYEWIYQKTPDFTNEMETRFDWGVVDVMFEVKGNLIVNGRVFSDCLFPDFIDKLNEVIQSKTITYDDKGVEKLCKTLRGRFPENPTFQGYIQNLQNWLPTVL